MLGLSRTLMCVCVALLVSLACSSTYDTDNLRIDGGGTAMDAAGNNDGGNDGGPDSGGSQTDASGNEPDAAVVCGDVGQPCCSEGIDSCNDEFLECSADGICEECGQDALSCCVTPPRCQDPLLVNCPAGLLCL
jgi:hypothetical protein